MNGRVVNKALFYSKITVRRRQKGKGQKMLFWADKDLVS